MCGSIFTVLKKNTCYLPFLLFIIVSPTIAQNLPAGFSFVPVAGGFDSPTAMVFAPDGRIFVAQQGGEVRIIKDGTLLSTPFISLSVENYGERGLGGIAIDPDFAVNHYIYLYYTVPSTFGNPSHNRASRFVADGDEVVPGSETVLIDFEPLLLAEIHNGGAMHFGADGKLYIGIGDNSASTTVQSLDNYRGKLLRINADGSMPTDNPYRTGSVAQRSIWAFGLRNPFTFAIHPQTGQILVNDVGYTLWEEINDATEPGKNFGWPEAEGNSDNPAFTNPTYTYAHGDGDGVGCAITGGTFLTSPNTNYPSEYVGRYFFHDFCNQWLNYLDFSTGSAVRQPFATGIPGFPVGLCEGKDGNLYFISRAESVVYKLIYTSTEAPAVTAQPISVSAFDGQPATFRVSVSGARPMAYQWYFEGNAIAGANNATYTIPSVSPAAVGWYRVVISNDFGSTFSDIATLTSLGPNAPPVPHILSPIHQSHYQAGTTIGFSATATDAEDGTLPASAFSWRLDFHHNIHKHDGPPIVVGMENGSFLIPNQGETSTNVFYRLILTVTDSKGLSHKDSVDILPDVAELTLTTDPPGLRVALNGYQTPTPISQSFVVGMLVNLSAPALQTHNGAKFSVVDWSPFVPMDGNITILPGSASYTASFITLPAFEIDPPIYNCYTGEITFRSSGGDGTQAEYFAPGITPWTTDANHVIDADLRNDPPIFNFYARQSGIEVSRSFDISAYCSNYSPVLQNALSPQTATVGRLFSYTIPANTFNDPEGGLIKLSATNLPSGIVFDATRNVFLGRPLVAETATVTVQAMDNQGATVTTALTIVIAPLANDCASMPVGQVAPDIASVQNGSWDTPSTWDCACIPAACNPVQIGHIVTIPANYIATANQIKYVLTGRLVLAIASWLRLGP
jgi:glucose/arabinose dehydrogenase